MEQPEDPLLVTYVIEEAPPGADWYSLEEAAELSAALSAAWTTQHIDSYPPELDRWLSAGYRKHLRRAKTSQFERMLEEVDGMILEGPHGRLFASEIHLKSETPRLLSKLQLSGFKCEERSHKLRAAPVAINLNEELGMSFGKAVIAAAHASQNLTLQLLQEHQDSFENWVNHGFHSSVGLGSIEPDSVQYAQVVDYGLTEVPAGSVTAIAQLR